MLERQDEPEVYSIKEYIKYFSILRGTETIGYINKREGDKWGEIIAGLSRISHTEQQKED